MKTLKKYILLIMLIAFNTFLIGCLEQPTSDEEVADDGMSTISGQFGSNSSSSVNIMSAVDYTLYKIYCVTFSDPVYVGEGQVGADGSFAVKVPPNQPMGCFVNSVSTNAPVATIVIEDSGSGFGGGQTSTISTSGNMNIGAVDLDLNTGVVTVPKARVESSIPATTNSLDLSQIHNKNYTMSCITTGNTQLDSDCSDFLAHDSTSVFFRVMNATDNGETLNGLGVWRSSTDFANCGSIDMTDTEKNQIETNDTITFDVGGIATAAAFESDNNICERRDAGSAADMDNIDAYYAAGPLNDNGDSYTLYVNDTHQIATGCERHGLTTVTFTYESGTTMVGNFNISETYEEQNPGDCGSNSNLNTTFNIRLTEQ